MAWFYKWDDQTLGQMPVSKFNEYWLAITHIEAEQFMIQSKIALLSETKRPEIKKWFSDLRAKLFRENHGKLSVKDIAAMIARGVGNGR